MGLAEIRSYDPPALDAFVGELLNDGFDVVEGSDGRKWQGPIDPAFAGLTDASTMVIHIRDGWPYKSPQILVEGLLAEHVGHDIVCLWRSDDNSLEWITLEGIRNRIADWCQRAVKGFDRHDLLLDAYLAFEGKDLALAAFDLPSLQPAGFIDGQWGNCHGVVEHDYLVSIGGGGGSKDSLRGRWYYRDDLPLPPPNIEAVRAALTSSQLKNLDRGIDRLLADQKGSIDFLLLITQHQGQHDVVAIRLRNDNGLSAKAMEPAPKDGATLIARAGRDADALQDKTVVVFGVGAIGGHTALMLAVSGLGKLELVDGERLRPGNVVRHLGNAADVGYHKVIVVAVSIERSAPWTTVDIHGTSPLDPGVIEPIIRRVDLAIDATGMANVTDALSRLSSQLKIPLVSVALYRNGTVARIRRQLVTDPPIAERRASTAFPLIPPAEPEEYQLEVGCSAPVFNAPPAACVIAAGLAASTAVDVLTGRMDSHCEFIQVIRADNELGHPFDSVGGYAIQHESL